jgi:quinoprotein glucose dehydrogenase
MRRAGGVCLLLLACASTGSSPLPLLAQQTRTAQDGVFTNAQATRGAVLYETRCAACHGARLEGSVGPELAGPGFLAVWGGQPLSDLFNKIEKTMPVDAPGTLSRVQVADIVAYALQTSRFPPGTTDLGIDDAALRQISLGSRAAVPTALGSGPSFPAVGNMNQVMRGILFPSSNVLFDVQTQDPGARPKPGARADAATTSSRYGDVYEPWAVVDAAAISLAEVGPLLMTPGRRCENGKPVPVDQADWQRWVRELSDAGRAAYKASQTRNAEMVSEVTNQVADACANCHRVYRDTASASSRCTPP